MSTLAALVVGAVVAARLARRAVHGQLGIRPGSRPSRVTNLVPVIPSPELASTLGDRGIVSPEQLAAMTPRERQMVLEAAARLQPPRSRASTPQLVRSVTGAGPAAGAAPPPVPPALAAPALDAIYCPACTALLCRESVMARGGAPCPKCGRRIAAQEGVARLVVTVSGARTAR